ncbi:unnamed protein product [Linum trigynum]|uniref:Uncharacterized protein n=1 Tax=Linum trigynum TaxID=586398 RepID=A0AAV2EC81_9ROSI
MSSRGAWGRATGNVRSFVGNCMGGLRGGTSVASWIVAGSIAYYLWVKPSHDLRRQQQERVALEKSRDQS